MSLYFFGVKILSKQLHRNDKNYPTERLTIMTFGKKCNDDTNEPTVSKELLKREALSIVEKVK